jgi:mRNA interferase YafQ
VLKPSFTKQFEKDLKLILRRGKNEKKIRDVMARLIKQEVLDPRHRDHKLSGNWIGRRDCHIEPDWLLIYQVDEAANLIVFERTGTHSDLFR